MTLSCSQVNAVRARLLKKLEKKRAAQETVPQPDQNHDPDQDQAQAPVLPQHGLQEN